MNCWKEWSSSDIGGFIGDAVMVLFAVIIPIGIIIAALLT